MAEPKFRVLSGCEVIERLLMSDSESINKILDLDVEYKHNIWIKSYVNNVMINNQILSVRGNDYMSVLRACVTQIVFGRSVCFETVSMTFNAPSKSSSKICLTHHNNMRTSYKTVIIITNIIDYNDDKAIISMLKSYKRPVQCYNISN